MQRAGHRARRLQRNRTGAERELQIAFPVGTHDQLLWFRVYACAAICKGRESAARLCDADYAWLFRREGETYRWAASYGHSKEKHERIKQYMLTQEHSPGRGSVVGRTVLERRPVQIADALADSEYTQTEAQKLAEYRTLLGVPLLREGVPIGAIALQRTDVRRFSDKQIELVTIFADQAVIAIENVRLFDRYRRARVSSRTRSKS